MNLIISSSIVCAVVILFYTGTFPSELTSLLEQTPLASFYTSQKPLYGPSTRPTSNSTSFFGLPLVPPTFFAPQKPTNMTVPRAIRQSFLAIEQSEGVGARVRRSIGSSKLRNFSPFLMLDHFNVASGGFPDHPHRGQETITYLLHGSVDHEDFTGRKGRIDAGDLQFMTAGRGIMHAEMPVHEGDKTAVNGMQLWVDLPEKLKTCEPRYRDLKANEIPTIKVDDGNVTIKIISGQSHGTDSVQELAYTPVWIFDIEIQPGGKVNQPLPVGWNAFAYTLTGSTAFGVGKDQTTIGQYHNVVFEQKGDSVTAEVSKDAKEHGKFILVAGLPLDQKVVQYGPFVVNSQDQVYQAMLDYQNHKNGFERAKGWRSEIGMGA